MNDHRRPGTRQPVPDDRGAEARNEPPLFPCPRPLSESQRAHLHRRLLEERRRITGRLARYGRATDADGSTPNRVPLHLADIGSDTMQKALDAAFASRDSRTLAEIDEALRRYYRDPARFGVDERTGTPISFERLDIIPWTRRA